MPTLTLPAGAVWFRWTHIKRAANDARRVHHARPANDDWHPLGAA